MLAGFLFLGLAAGSAILVQTGPRYSSEAFVQPKLTSEVTGVGNSQGSLSIDAADLVAGAAKIMRSRAVADAVVDRLGLDTGPAFSHPSLLTRWWSEAQVALRLESASPGPHELAVKAVMRQIRVTTDPHSYVIPITATAGDPETAATLANAFAFEYLRIQTSQELAKAQTVAEQDVADRSLTYGIRHPSYRRALTKLEQLQAQTKALHAATREGVGKLVAGYSVIPAEKVLMPSGPNILLILIVSVGVALAAGVSLAKLLDSRTTRGS
jgi:uncharacterized protein involved in exopolysaccharide biosynthesis